jgi:uncharacterized OB-fold protein
MAETMTLTFDFPMSNLDEHFFAGLKEGALQGTVCRDCDACYVPPRRRCPGCLVEMTEWRTLGHEGTVAALTIVAYKFDGLPEPPYALAYVQPDGADTCILNYLEHGDAVAAGQVAVGDRVGIRFKDEGEREGRITDFEFVAL